LTHKKSPVKKINDGTVGQDRRDKLRLVIWRRRSFIFLGGVEKMKTQRLESCMRAPKLVAQIAAGRLGCKMTEPYIYGTYLELWWRCLKFSKEFTQSCRTGIFTSRDAYRTFCIFGDLEDLTFQEWWLTKGHEFFSESITTLQVTLYVKRPRWPVQIPPLMASQTPPWWDS